MAMTTTGGTVAGQPGLFGDAVPGPVLMALHGEYCDLIWRRLKTHWLWRVPQTSRHSQAQDRRQRQPATVNQVVKA
jgi:hypothetical protein